MVKLEYYGGIGFWACDNVGKFEVEAKSGNKLFRMLNAAKEYYNSLNEEKAFWDLSNTIPELIDAWTEKETN